MENIIKQAKYLENYYSSLAKFDSNLSGSYYSIASAFKGVATAGEKTLTNLERECKSGSY